MIWKLPRSGTFLRVSTRVYVLRTLTQAHKIDQEESVCLLWTTQLVHLQVQNHPTWPHSIPEPFSLSSHFSWDNWPVISPVKQRLFNWPAEQQNLLHGLLHLMFLLDWQSSDDICLGLLNSNLIYLSLLQNFVCSLIQEINKNFGAGGHRSSLH